MTEYKTEHIYHTRMYSKHAVKLLTYVLPYAFDHRLVENRTHFNHRQCELCYNASANPKANKMISTDALSTIIDDYFWPGIWFTPEGELTLHLARWAYPSEIATKPSDVNDDYMRTLIARVYQRTENEEIESLMVIWNHALKTNDFSFFGAPLNPFYEEKMKSLISDFLTTDNVIKPRIYNILFDEIDKYKDDGFCDDFSGKIKQSLKKSLVKKFKFENSEFYDCFEPVYKFIDKYSYDKLCWFRNIDSAVCDSQGLKEMEKMLDDYTNSLKKTYVNFFMQMVNLLDD